jgi:hypothetical protein
MTDITDVWRATSESQLQSSVVTFMRWRGWMCYHTYDSRRSEKGYPDLTAVKGNRMMFVEFKTEKGKPKPEQIEWLDALVEAHDDVYLVRPSTEDDFLEEVEKSGSNLTTHWRNQRGG